MTGAKFIRCCACTAISISLFLASCSSPADDYQVHSAQLTLEFNSQMHSKISTDFGSKVALEDQYSPSEFVVVDGELVEDFTLSERTEEDVIDLLGSGQRYTFVGVSDSDLEKSVDVTRYDAFPGMLTLQVTYTNNAPSPITVSKWTNNAHSIAAGNASPSFWSYQGASFEDRRDWVMPVAAGYSQDNYMGMNASDYGNGTPVSNVWRPDVGIAVGHLETVPKLVSLPVRYPDSGAAAQLGVEYEYDFELATGEKMSTIETFVFVHEGDYYATLKNYRHAMERKGLKLDPAPDSAYEAIWCAWGYDRIFAVDEVTSALPKAAELGLKWAVIDDGWQVAEGDWSLHPEKFPNGDDDMRALVSEIEDAGLKAKLWWAPLAADPGTELLEQHEDMLILDEDGEPVDITWWDSYYLCPAYDKTVEYSTELVTEMLADWGYKGLKIDGQHLNGVPECHNPAHNHERPEESVEALQDFWKAIYDTALAIDKETVVEICPCGTSYAFFNIPYMNQSVSSDPLSSWQVRLKGKTLKALAGDSAPYYGDHVEMSDGGDDFASTLGIGGIVGTKFTLPSDNPDAQEELLTPEKELHWKKWIGLYNELMLSKGEYLGELYDIGFDLPEAHAIEKDGAHYYAFYAEQFDGEVELRGLETKDYVVVDYVDGGEIGVVTGPTARIDAKFEGHLLVSASPVADSQE